MRSGVSWPGRRASRASASSGAGGRRRAARLRPAAPEDADARLARLPGHDTPERMLGEFEQRRQLQLALEALPQEQRDVVLLRLEQELTLDQIGAITGVGRETVKSRLRYAMDKLRLQLPATSEP